MFASPTDVQEANCYAQQLEVGRSPGQILRDEDVYSGHGYTSIPCAILLESMLTTCKFNWTMDHSQEEDYEQARSAVCKAVNHHVFSVSNCDSTKTTVMNLVIRR